MSTHSWNDPHMIKAAKAIGHAFFVTIGTSLMLFSVFHVINEMYVSVIANDSLYAFNNGIAQDLDYLGEQGDILAQDKRIKEALLLEDSSSLIRIIQNERQERSIGLIGVADADGVIIGRTKSFERKGDNIFLTNVVGRAVARGESVQSIESPFGFEPNQLLLTTGRPIKEDDEVIGALFANYLTDDGYAKDFKKKYLPKNVEVVFYSKKAGIYGNSFSDPEIKKITSSYFNQGSDWLQHGISGRTVSFSINSTYLVENIIFPGLEESPGGALLFIPRKDFSVSMRIILAGAVLLIFISLILYHHSHSRKEERGWRYYTLVSAFSIPVIILVYFALHFDSFKYTRLEIVPYPLYNSTLRLEPEAGLYAKDFEQRIGVIVDRGDELINAVQFRVVFDPKKIEIRSLDLATSTCEFLIEKSIDARSGSADLSCVLSDSVQGSGPLRLANLVIVPRETGEVAILFDTEVTKVLAKDGLATNVLRMSQSGSYRINEFNNEPSSEQKSFLSKEEAIPIFSTSHPNEVRWYSNREARFVWLGNNDQVYAYDFDSYPNTTPTANHIVQGTEVRIPVPGDGIFYFHLQSVLGGPVAHYRIQSDTTPPIISRLNPNAGRIMRGDVVRFSFEANDVSSGIQKNYYMSFGGRLFLPVGKEVSVPFLNTGNNQVTLRVYDNAGNYTDKQTIVYVE